MLNKISQKHVVKFLYGVLILTIINVVIYGVLSGIIGGDALKGYEIDGVYYVYHSGKYIQVSENSWYLSRIPGEILNATFPAAVSAAMLINILKKFGKDK